jgi:hypothetical protein
MKMAPAKDQQSHSDTKERAAEEQLAQKHQHRSSDYQQPTDVRREFLHFKLTRNPRHWHIDVRTKLSGADGDCGRVLVKPALQAYD